MERKRTHLEEQDRLLPVSGGAPGRRVQTVKCGRGSLLFPLYPLDAAAELDGEVDADPVDVAVALWLQIENWA